jgi:hypothetical protein
VKFLRSIDFWGWFLMGAVVGLMLLVLSGRSGHTGCDFEFHIRSSTTEAT